MIIQYDNASYPVRDKSSVEKGNHSPLPHAVRYATNESQCCIPTACCIVSEHVLLPIFNPYRDLKKNRHWMYFGLSHDNRERDNLIRRSAIAKCIPSYPVRDKSSVEKGNHSPLPHAVRYATNESRRCIPTACSIVSKYVSLPNCNPYRDLKKNRHWMYFGLSHDNIERDNLNRRSAIAKCTPSYPVRDKSSVEKGNHYPLPHAVRYATNESQCCIPTACYFVRERHCGLDPQSPNPKNNQEIAGQARNDEMRQFEVSTQLQSLSGFEKQP